MEGAIGGVNLEKCYSNNTATTIATTNNNNNNTDHLNLPPGFKFHPTDEEIMIHYLIKKIIDSNFTATAMGEVDLNRCEPWDLPKRAKTMGEKEWYFFCERDRKYPTGMRTNRATESGYWKATGKDKEIYSKSGGNNYSSKQKQVVGMKKTLVFYKGRAPKGQKMDWVMHEFRLEGNFSHYTFPKSAKDRWVVCRIIHRNAPTTVKPSSMLDLTRMNSFVEGLLDSPTLPHLMDSPYFSDHDEKFNAPNSNTSNNLTSSNVQESSYGTTTTSTSSDHGNTIHYNQLQMQQQTCSLTTSFNPSNNIYQMPNSTFYSQNPNHSSLTTDDEKLLLLHQQQFDYTLPNFKTPKQISDQADQLQRHCKVEQTTLLSNESIMVSQSQDTGHSTDVTTEISSLKQEDTYRDNVQLLFDDIEDDSVIGPLSDLDSFWS